MLPDTTFALMWEASKTKALSLRTFSNLRIPALLEFDRPPALGEPKGRYAESRANCGRRLTNRFSFRILFRETDIPDFEILSTPLVYTAAPLSGENGPYCPSMSLIGLNVARTAGKTSSPPARVADVSQSLRLAMPLWLTPELRLGRKRGRGMGQWKLTLYSAPLPEFVAGEEAPPSIRLRVPQGAGIG
jgi:hypothetical protein